MTRTGKYIMEGVSRFRKYAQGILPDETIDLMEQNGYRQLKQTQSINEDELAAILGRYLPPDEESKAEDTIEELTLELTDRKSVYFEPKVYAAAKDWAKEDGVSLGEYINKAVDNLNLANQMLRDMSKELDEAKAISSKYE